VTFSIIRTRTPVQGTDDDGKVIFIKYNGVPVDRIEPSAHGIADVDSPNHEKPATAPIPLDDMPPKAITIGRTSISTKIKGKSKDLSVR